MYVHAPYLINFSGSKRVFDLSCQEMWEQGKLAEKYDVQGIVVHGGSYKEHKDRDQALEQWGLALTHYDKLDYPPILIENAASGKYSLTRYTQDIRELWEWVQETEAGFCLDTAHLWAAIGAPEQAELYIEEVREIVGEIQLVHANGSGVACGAGVDRHSPLDVSDASPDWVAWCVKLAQPRAVITETTAPAADVALLRRLLDE